MPKKIDPKVNERCVRQVMEHLPEYPSLTAAAEVVARREGVGKESVGARHARRSLHKRHVHVPVGRTLWGLPASTVNAPWASNEPSPLATG